MPVASQGRDGIYVDKILVSECKLFKRSNKANLFIALVQKPVSQIKMTFQEIRIIATGPCISNQLRDANTICRRSWYIDDVLSINNPRFAEFLPLIYPPELEIKENTDTASSASFVDLYLEFYDSGQLSTKIYDKQDD
jgi:hypothetical protein